MAFESARLRATVITVGLLVQLGSAVPDRPLQAKAMARAEGQRVVMALQHALLAIGVHAGAAGITATLIDYSERLVRLRNVALAPFEPWFRHTQTHQQWRLFVSPNRECFRLRIEASTSAGAKRRQANWALLYRASDVNRLGLSSQLRYRRLRGIYNPSARRGARANYEGFANWLAAGVLARRPEYARVRVRMERLLIGARGAKLRRLGFEHAITRARQAAQ